LITRQPLEEFLSSDKVGGGENTPDDEELTEGAFAIGTWVLGICFYAYHKSRSAELVPVKRYDPMTRTVPDATKRADMVVPRLKKRIKGIFDGLGRKNVGGDIRWLFGEEMELKRVAGQFSDYYLAAHLSQIRNYP
jgi:hypothetical protein